VVDSKVTCEIFYYDDDYSNLNFTLDDYKLRNADYVKIERRHGMFPDTIWSLSLGSDGLPSAKRSTGDQMKFLTTSILSARCEQEDGTGAMFLEDKVEPCEVDHYLPFWPGPILSGGMWGMGAYLGIKFERAIPSAEWEPSEPKLRDNLAERLDDIEKLMVTDKVVEKKRDEFRKEVQKPGSFVGGKRKYR
jgi:hypothetical protein